jgi:hypothetical protein
MPLNPKYLFMNEAKKLIGDGKSYYQMFAIYKIPFVYQLHKGRKRKAFLASAVRKLAEEVQRGKVGRM